MLLSFIGGLSKGAADLVSCVHGWESVAGIKNKGRARRD